MLAGISVIVGLCCIGAVTDQPKSPSKKTGTENVVVPELVGDSMDTVYDQLEAIGLNGSASNGYGGSDWDSDSIVMSVDPPSGTRVAVGSTVKISEATKAEIAFYKKPMPDLIGSDWMDIGSGRTESVYLYFQTKFRDARGKEKPGTIVGQKPSAGTRMKFRTKITVTVANYPSSDSGGSGTWPGLDGPNVCRRTKWC